MKINRRKLWDDDNRDCFIVDLVSNLELPKFTLSSAFNCKPRFATVAFSEWRPHSASRMPNPNPEFACAFSFFSRLLYRIREFRISLHAPSDDVTGNA